MKTFINQLIKYILIFALGAMTYGFIGAALKVSAERNNGNFGGEVFVLPLLLGLIWFGWELANFYIKGVYGKRQYKKGYAIGRYQAMTNYKSTSEE